MIGSQEKLELLNRVDEAELKGFVVVLKWDGERDSTKKTLFISDPKSDLFIRRDSDDLWNSLKDALNELDLFEKNKL